MSDDEADVNDYDVAKARTLEEITAQRGVDVPDHTKPPVIPVREDYQHAEPVVTRRQLGGMTDDDVQIEAARKQAQKAETDEHSSRR